MKIFAFRMLFQVSVDKIHGGDRAGICVTQFDPKLLERGLVRTMMKDIG